MKNHLQHLWNVPPTPPQRLRTQKTIPISKLKPNITTYRLRLSHESHFLCGRISDDFNSFTFSLAIFPIVDLLHKFYVYTGYEFRYG